MMNGPYPQVSAPGGNGNSSSSQGGRPDPLRNGPRTGTGYMAEVPYKGPDPSGYYGGGTLPPHPASQRRDRPPPYSSSSNGGRAGPRPGPSHHRDLASSSRASHGFLGGIRDRLRQARANQPPPGYGSRHYDGRGRRPQRQRGHHGEKGPLPAAKNEGTSVVVEGAEWGPEVQGALAFMRQIEAEETKEAAATKGKANSKPPHPPPPPLPPSRVGNPALRHKESFVPYGVNSGSGSASGGRGNTYNTAGSYHRDAPPQQPMPNIPLRRSSIKSRDFQREKRPVAPSPPRQPPRPSPVNPYYESGNGSANTTASSIGGETVCSVYGHGNDSAATAASTFGGDPTSRRRTVRYRSVGTQTDMQHSDQFYKLSVWPRSAAARLGLDGGSCDVYNSSSSSHGPPSSMLPIMSPSNTAAYNSTATASPPSTSPSPPPKPPQFLSRALARLAEKIGGRCASPSAPTDRRTAGTYDASDSDLPFEEEQLETRDQSLDQGNQQDAGENSQREAARRFEEDVVAELPPGHAVTEALLRQNLEVYGSGTLPSPYPAAADSRPSDATAISAAVAAFHAEVAAHIEGEIEGDDEGSVATATAPAGAEKNTDSGADGCIRDGGSDSGADSDATAVLADDGSSTAQAEVADRHSDDSDLSSRDVEVVAPGVADGGDAYDEAGDDSDDSSFWYDEDEIEKEHRDQDVDEGCPPPRAARKSRLETIVEDAE